MVGSNLFIIIVVATMLATPLYALTSDEYLAEIRKYSQKAEKEKRPRLFLELLGPLHDRWHRENPRSFGFLLFHHAIIKEFKRLGLDREMNIKAFTDRDFSQGKYRRVGRFSATLPRRYEDLARYSRNLEQWHNEAHHEIGQADRINLMNPRTNIKLPQFWRLHFYIEDKFNSASRSIGVNNMEDLEVTINTAYPELIPRI